MHTIVMVLALMASLTALSFPKASAEKSSLFWRSYRECLEENCSKSLAIRSDDNAHFSSSAFRRLLDFGPEILELIYQASISNEIERAVADKLGQKAMSIKIEKETVLGRLWARYSLRFSTKFTDVDSIWDEEPIWYLWEGGDALSEERAEFLIAEMRLARRENRLLDARRAMGNLQMMGVFAFPTLFGELVQGHDDVVAILSAAEWNWGETARPAIDKEWLLNWWEANSAKYKLPPRSAGFRGTAKLEEWRRIETRDRKIRSYSPDLDGWMLQKETNSASELTAEDLLGCFASVWRRGTNLCFKCKSSPSLRYRCIFNGIEYGRRWSKYDEILELPEGNNLTLRNDDCELTFLPIASAVPAERGFFVVLKKTDGAHSGQTQTKRGFLLFGQLEGKPARHSAKRGKDNSLTACRFDGVELVFSLTGTGASPSLGNAE